eukprot:gnl/MRDRNA2_/MRDRNA2_86318_c0_seq1.p1 gnl/MRDRNA2_/MRDRNA2_86318_c0~~gnl/MRDRNA2_/MRDRNA2_86318_c0_seq1.p1  ORF type:complete len:625 (-),score=-6.64 gnl/MRDRNA2_/MRDRNA2_86318_c0_seq1:610-2484(-)
MICSQNFFYSSKKLNVLKEEHYPVLKHNIKNLHTYTCKWNVVITSYLCSRREIDSLDTSRRLYQEGLELLSQTLEALVIFFGCSGRRELVLVIYEAMKTRNMVLTSPIYAKMNVSLSLNDINGVIAESEMGIEAKSPYRSNQPNRLLIEALIDKRDIEALDVSTSEKVCPKTFTASLLPIVQTLALHFADTSLIRTLIKNVFKTRTNKHFLSASEIVKNEVLRSIFDAFEAANQSWPSTQCPAETSFFKDGLKIMTLLYPKSCLVSEKYGSPNLRTIELSLIANTLAKRRLSAFHDFLTIYEAGYNLPRVALDLTIAGLSHIPKAMLHFVKMVGSEMHLRGEMLTQNPYDRKSLGIEWLAFEIDSFEHQKNMKRLSSNLDSVIKHLCEDKRFVDGYSVSQSEMIINSSYVLTHPSKSSESEIKIEPITKNILCKGGEKNICSKIQQSREQFKNHILTLIKRDAEKVRHQRIRRRDHAIKQLRKKRFLIQQKQVQSNLVNTLSVKVLRYHYNKPEKTWKENILLTDPSWFVAELLDGLPQHVNDFVSYQVFKNDYESNFEKVSVHKLGLIMKDLENFHDIDLLDSALDSVKVGLDASGHLLLDNQTSSKRVSVIARISNLVKIKI